MARILGGATAVWLIYALLSLCFKHKIGFLITAILFVFSGIFQILGSGDFFNLIATILAIICIHFIIPLQIRSKKKEAWKQRRQNRI